MIKIIKEKLRNKPSTFMFLQIFAYEMHLLKIRIKNKIIPSKKLKINKYKNQKNLRLHWGCGSRKLHKWVNVIVRVIQHQVDVYINGNLAKRHILKGVPKQNYGDVYVSLNGGFSGKTSEVVRSRDSNRVANVLASATSYSAVR